MVTCPSCSASLPDWAQQCQFCQSDVRNVPRPAQPNQRPSRALPTGAPKWIWPAYYVASTYFLLHGLFQVVSGFVTMSRTTEGVAGETVGRFSIMGVIIGAVYVIIGAGLLAKVEFIRGIVNFFCFLTIAVAALGLFGSLLGGIIVGPVALLYAALHVLDIVMAGAMIYLIGETD